MTHNATLQIIFLFLILILIAPPIGYYIAGIYQGTIRPINRFLGPLEQILYRVCGIDPHREMDWKQYLSAMLLLNALGFLVTYAIQRLQATLPFNPQSFSEVPPLIAFNTATSFVTNTNWQAYAGEKTLSYFTQAGALTVQQFISAATGMSLLMALIRGLIAEQKEHLGNFWVDTLRGILYVLLPLSCVLALFLVSQGTIQNTLPYQSIQPLQSFTAPSLSKPQGRASAHHNSEAPLSSAQVQQLPMGPVASQVAIKILGSNGGGFFNTNAAHPFENPSPLACFVQLIGLLLIPVALCITFGSLVGDKRQGWAILITMLLLTLPLVYGTCILENQTNPLLEGLPLIETANIEGKETRFGITQSAIWATFTTATSNGSVNAMLDAFMPLGGMIPLWLMQLGEVTFGGVGSGLSGMLVMVIIAVFIAGLMVGRTPEYLGKKIEPHDLKMACLAVLIPPLLIVLVTAIAVLNPLALSASNASGPHGFTQVLYAFTSMVYNNGSAFSGLQADNHFYTVVGSICMLIGRYGVAIPTLAMAGSLARKKKIATSAGTLLTHTPLFIGLLIAIVLLLGALSFFPALSLGPIAEHFLLWEKT
ncbi:MAG: potassium translocating ATPase, subunit [Pseudomonadota bacterium]|jgi:K+-transporting ATPase ATPase A chain